MEIPDYTELLKDLIKFRERVQQHIKDHENDAFGHSLSATLIVFEGMIANLDYNEMRDVTLLMMNHIQNRMSNSSKQHLQ